MTTWRIPGGTQVFSPLEAGNVSKGWWQLSEEGGCIHSPAEGSSYNGVHSPAESEGRQAEAATSPSDLFVSGMQPEVLSTLGQHLPHPF